MSDVDWQLNGLSNQKCYELWLLSVAPTVCTTICTTLCTTLCTTVCTTVCTSYYLVNNVFVDILLRYRMLVAYVDS